jgi:putative peptidoglycan lipid II flippase
VPPLPSQTAPPEGTPPRRFGNSAVVAFGILVSRLFGILREILRAAYLGASQDIVGDAWATAIRIPNLLQNLLGEGVLSASLVPVYARLLADGDEEEAGRLAGAIGAILGVVTATLVVAGVILAPELVHVLAPTWTGEKYALTVTLTRILFPGAALFVMAAWCIGVLNSHRRFLVPYLAPVAWNLAMIAAFLWFGGRRTSESLVITVAWASVAGAALQFLVQLPSVLHLVRKLRVSLDVRRASVRRVLRNFGPVGLSRGVVQISGFLDLWIANLLPQGSPVFLMTAQTLNMLPVSLFGMAVSASELPELSSLRGTDEERMEMVRTRVRAGSRRIAYFVIPSAIAFMALGDVIIRLLYERGKWVAIDTRFTWAVLAGSGVGLLASTVGRLYASAFYAMHDARRPLRFAVVRLLLTVVLGYGGAIWLTNALGVDRRWGTAALTVTAGIAGWVEYWLLRRALEERVGSVRTPPAYLLTLWSVAIAAAALAASVKYLVVPRLPGTGFWYSVAESALVLGTFGVVYLSTTIALNVPEADALRRRLLRR